jgi:sigma-B regulation protein RsbU (phosphoserine phosphatase)
VVIGDVAGHGLAPALVMAQARAFLRASCGAVDDLAGLVARLNDFLARDMTRGIFMTLCAALVDAATGRVEICNAGHPPALLLRVDGSIERFGASGVFLGVLAGTRYTAAPPTTLGPGDLLVLYTDGAVEQTDPDDRQFGEERFLATLQASRGLAAPAVLEAVRAALVGWAKAPGLGDDLTLVALCGA